MRLEVACRVYEAMSEALARDVDDLVIVTHGVAASFVVAAWIGMPIEAAGHVAFPVRPGSITTLREDAFFHNRAVLALGEASLLQRRLVKLMPEQGRDRAEEGLALLWLRTSLAVV